MADEKKFFDRINQNQFYKKWFRSSFTYVTGAVLLSLLQVATLASTGNPWGVSSTFAYWGAWLYEAIGGNVDKWSYFSSGEAQAALNAGFLNHPDSWRNIGIIFGALLATLMASQFKIKKIRSKKQVVAAILGGLLMGYGARVALGCNIGALYSGIASMSLSGWVYLIGIFSGAFVGGKLLVKFFM
jgi:hypothetical protein